MVDCQSGSSEEVRLSVECVNLVSVILYQGCCTEIPSITRHLTGFKVPLESLTHLMITTRL